MHPGDRGYELVSWVQDRLHLLRSVPMLILWGMKDFVFDHHFLDEWVRYFPDGGGAPILPRPATTFSRTKRTRSTTWCPPFSRPTPPSRSTSVESNLRPRRAIEHRHPPEPDGHAPAAHHGRGRTGRPRPGRPRPLHAPDLPAARSGQQSDRARAEGVRDRPRHAGRGDGAARARLLLARVRPVQGRRRARVDRPRNRPAQPGSMLPRGRAGGLHRHFQGTLGAAALRLGARDRAADHPGRAGRRRSAGFRLQDARRPAARRRRVSRARARSLRLHRLARPGRDRGDSLYQRQHRSPQGRRLYSRDLSGAGGIVSLALRDRARRDRSLHFPALRPLRACAGHDGDRARHGSDASGPGQSGQDLRGHRRFRRDEPVRLARSVAAARAGRQEPSPCGCRP